MSEIRTLYDAVRRRRALEIKNEVSKNLSEVEKLQSTELKSYIDFTRSEAFTKPNRVTAKELKDDPEHQSHLFVQFEDPSEFYLAFTYNISKGGIFLKTGTAMPLGLMVLLTIRIEALNVEWTVPGKIIWVSNFFTSATPAGMRVKFVRLSKKESEILEDFVSGDLDPGDLKTLG